MNDCDGKHVPSAAIKVTLTLQSEQKSDQEASVVLAEGSGVVSCLISLASFALRRRVPGHILPLNMSDIEARLAAASSFILQSPPGEVNDVL